MQEALGPTASTLNNLKQLAQGSPCLLRPTFKGLLSPGVKARRGGPSTTRKSLEAPRIKRWKLDGMTRKIGGITLRKSRPRGRGPIRVLTKDLSPLSDDRLQKFRRRGTQPMGGRHKIGYRLQGFVGANPLENVTLLTSPALLHTKLPGS